MKNTKITNDEILEAHVEGASDSLIGTPVTQIKQIFDKLPKLVAKKHNELIDGLSMSDAATAIGSIKNGLASNVQSDLDTLSNEIKGISQGAIPDNSIAVQKLNGNLRQMLTYTLLHSVLSGSHALTGDIPLSGFATIRFKTTASSDAATSWTINGVDYTAQTISGNPIDELFVLGATVCGEVDIGAKKINFKQGGGAAPSLFGNGSDGDLYIKSGQTVVIPISNPHKEVILRQYNSIFIETGGVLTTSAPNCGLVLRCRGDCVINGKIDQSGKAGYSNDEISFLYPEITGGRGGYGGGGGKSATDNQYVLSVNGGKRSSNTPSRIYGGGIGGSGGGGASGGIKDYRSGSTPTAVSGNIGVDGVGSNYTSSLSAGGNTVYSSYSKATHSGYGGNGGKPQFGGGLLMIYCGGLFKNYGMICCDGMKGLNGGNGGIATGYISQSPSGYGYAGGGGGGAGGSGGGGIYICYKKEYINSGILSVVGGIGGLGGLKGTAATPTEAVGALDGEVGELGATGQIKTIKYEKGMTV